MFGVKRPSLTAILCACFIGYIIYSIWVMAQLFVPPPCPPGQPCLSSFLAKKPSLQLLLYTSLKSNPSSDNEVAFVHNLERFDYNSNFETELTLSLPQETRRNGSLYLHMFVAPSQKAARSFSELKRDRHAVQTRIKLTHYQVPTAAAFNLLGATPGHDTAQTSADKNLQTVTHIKSKVSFNVMTDVSALPRNNLPPEIARLLILSSNWEYLPIVQYDFLNNRIRDLVEVKSSNATMNLTLLYSPIGIGKLRLVQHMELSLTSLSKFGFSKKDVDEVKGIFADTNLYLLCLTIFISSVHMLFDFLAFKHDINFWRKRQNFEGLSTRTVLWRAFSQGVVFLYLCDENSSMLILVPTGIGTIIETWKVQKVLRVELVIRGVYIPRVRFIPKGSSKGEQQTEEFDAESMRYLSYLLYPLCLCGAIYSLLYEPHKSWYSWSVHSLVNGVYAFGFLFMLPQLFVNYKLKSVAHLPWRAFMYKAFNTFIDDLFAFIITMPTAHRVACFRDDFVFLIYLYQRWLYPVDKTRRDVDVPMEIEPDKKND